MFALSSRVRCLSLLYLLCLSIWRTAWHARASVLPPRTQYTHTHESVRQLCKSSSPTSELKTNCKFAYRSTVARFLRRTRCKYYKKKPKNITLCLNEILKFSFFCVLFENNFTLIFRKSIYALSMPTCSTPAQSCIKFQKKKTSLKYVYFFLAKSTHTHTVAIFKQTNKSISRSNDRL